jgi:DNA-binding Lrp family transcriptional regulator
MMTTISEAVPTTHNDPVNAQILAISEDRIHGFVRDPIGEIARLSGVDEATVIERVQAMLRAGGRR